MRQDQYVVNVYLVSGLNGSLSPVFWDFRSETDAVEDVAEWLEGNGPKGDYLHTIIHDGCDKVRCLDFNKEAADMVLRWRQERRSA